MTGKKGSDEKRPERGGRRPARPLMEGEQEEATVEDFRNRGMGIAPKE